MFTSPKASLAETISLTTITAVNNMEKEDFIIKRYEIRHASHAARKIRILHIADLHGENHGEKNAVLIQKAAGLHPDLILCAGDMIVGRPGTNFDDVLYVYEKLMEIAPVYAANGNHESKIRRYRYTYRRYVSELRKRGVILVNNRTESLVQKDREILITGIEIPLSKYKKMRIPSLTDGEVERMIGICPKKNAYHILLAHNPQFADAYFRWGADLIVSGHFHGGMVRMKDRAAMSPYGFPLPKYGYGRYERGSQNLIVSAGLGDHAIPVRVNNPMELVCIDVSL